MLFRVTPYEFFDETGESVDVIDIPDLESLIALQKRVDSAALIISSDSSGVWLSVKEKYGDD